MPFKLVLDMKTKRIAWKLKRNKRMWFLQNILIAASKELF